MDEKGKKSRLSAPQYIDYIMTYVQKTINDEGTFPTKHGKSKISWNFGIYGPIRESLVPIEATNPDSTFRLAYFLKWFIALYFLPKFLTEIFELQLQNFVQNF